MKIIKTKLIAGRIIENTLDDSMGFIIELNNGSRMHIIEREKGILSIHTTEEAMGVRPMASNAVDIMNIKWFKKEKDFFIATPEKALVDAFYLISYGRYAIDISALDAAKFDRDEIKYLSIKFPLKTRNLLKKHGYLETA